MQSIDMLLILDRVEFVASCKERHLIHVLQMFIMIELEFAKLAEFFLGAFDLLLQLFEA